MPCMRMLLSYFTWALSSSQHTADWVNRTETATYKGGWEWVEKGPQAAPGN